MSTYYIDYENGDDSNAGDSFAAGHPWKTITLGATAARIAPGDIIKIAKSPAPTPLAGTTATWTNLSKTVTLNTAENATIENCEADWTEVNATSSDKIGTDWKEGTYALKMVEDGTPAADEVQCYSDLYTHDTTVHNLSGYQKISFWIKNEVAILANQLEINLCSNADGTGDVDTFAIPAIPSTGRWIPLTITKNGGGNLGSAIKSINISNGSNATTYTASKYIYIDNIIACTTAGLNLQSLISKNSAEQGGTEGWYGIQSIVGTTVLLDNDTNTKANAGKGYSTTGTSPETVNTYKRETIKTSFASTDTTVIQEIMDSGSLALGNIQFQAGYDTGTGEQTGETFFDGLNNKGYGIRMSSKNYITLNYFNFIRYYHGLDISLCSFIEITNLSNINNNIEGFYSDSLTNSTITNLSNANNNYSNGINFINSNFNNTIVTISNANNNISGNGVKFVSSSNNKITTISNVNNNTYGVSFDRSFDNTIVTISNANSGSRGLHFLNSSNNKITTLSTTGNSAAGIYYASEKNYIYSATIAESPTVASMTAFFNAKLFITKLNGDYSAIYTDNGSIISRASTLVAGSGTEWVLATNTDNSRKLSYPLKLTVAKIAVVANKEVTVTCYFKKGHATNIGARLVFPAQLGEVEHYATCPDDTNENNLSIAFTPTEAGVCEIEAWAYYIAGHSTVIVDAITITQAD